MAMETQAYTIETFCRVHHISRPMFYRLKKNGLAPKTMKLGKKRLVSVEEAQAWRQRMTEETFFKEEIH